MDMKKEEKWESSVFFTGLDELFAQGKLDQVEPYFEAQKQAAESRQDVQARIIILNEMMGFYRETSQYDKARAVIGEVLPLMQDAGLEDTLPYGTTLLNCGNALRAAGDLERSMTCYRQVFAIFEHQVKPGDFRYAELYNNVSLLYQELGRYDMAGACLEKALHIVKEMPDKEFETAVTYANLGSSELQQGKLNAAVEHIKQGITLFAALGVQDTHMAAAVSALGEAYYRQERYDLSIAQYERALEMIEQYVGKTEAYERVLGNLTQVREKYALQQKDVCRKNGMELCLEFYETRGRQMIHEQFREYENRIAAGRVGEGSECFGFDDRFSEDHDFGAGFSLWLTREDYRLIGKPLQEAYDRLLQENGLSGTGLLSQRTGVYTVSDFYEGLTGYPEGPVTVQEWAEAAGSEDRLAAAVNGAVFTDPLGVFTGIRERIQAYYPREVWLRLLAQYVTRFSQSGQYNYERMAKREDFTAAAIAREDAVICALHLVYLCNRTYAPHDKWLRRGIKELPLLQQIGILCDKLVLTDIRDIKKNSRLIEEMAGELYQTLTELRLIYSKAEGDVLFMARYGKELAEQADLWEYSTEQLAEDIAKMEFAAFDEVINEGGRAGCQDDFETFRIMRISQYLTWKKEMLVQYILEFQDSMEKGRNMITEKYARMMESTAPEKYKKFQDKLPPIPEEKRAIAEEIIKIQVEWMEEFRNRYPHLAFQARIIHTKEDTQWDTSYETYLRGELLTYSDSLLILYGRFVAELAAQGKNLAELTIRNTARLYGYDSLEEAEKIK